MNLKNILYLILLLLGSSCKNYLEKEPPTNYEYHAIQSADTARDAILYAVTDEEHLQYGANVAYVDAQNDTIVPFGKFAYFGTDTMQYYANVILHPNDSTYGRTVGIDRYGNILFDLVMFDNGPDYFREGLTRVKQNGKMGFANNKGEIVIPCQYDYARGFHNGKAEVTYEASKYFDLDEHMQVESDAWFTINKKGEPVKTP